MLIYVGSSPPEPEAQREGLGISAFATDSDGGLRPLARPVEAPAPSFLATHPRVPVLYAVSTVDDGAILAFAIAPNGGLRPVSSRPSGGAMPIHLAISPDGSRLLCANWGSGSVAVLPLDGDGALGPPGEVVHHDGKAYAHHVSFDGSQVTVVHLGANALYGYRLRAPGRLHRTWVTAAQPGAGPRHLAVHPSGRRYVADELGSTVSTYVPDPATGALRRTHTRPATLVEPAGPNHLSEIAVSPDGRFVYVASRGNDTVTTFTADTEVPQPVDEVPSGGAFPRHFALAGHWMYVANERSHSITALRLDDGVPRPTGIAVSTPSPTCILPRPVRQRPQEEVGRGSRRYSRKS
jgi:6-phosphogluconolactonase